MSRELEELEKSARLADEAVTTIVTEVLLVEQRLQSLQLKLIQAKKRRDEFRKVLEKRK